MNITIEHILAVLFSTVLFALTSADMILKKLQNWNKISYGHLSHQVCDCIFGIFEKDLLENCIEVPPFFDRVLCHLLKIIFHLVWTPKFIVIVYQHV